MTASEFTGIAFEFNAFCRENPDDSSSFKFYVERYVKYRYWCVYGPNGTLFLVSMVFLLLTLKLSRKAEKNRKSLRSPSRLTRRRTSLRLSLNKRYDILKSFIALRNEESAILFMS